MLQFCEDCHIRVLMPRKTPHIVLLFTCLAMLGCTDSTIVSNQDSEWDSYRYIDNDATYSLPAGTYSCVDDSPGCI